MPTVPGGGDGEAGTDNQSMCKHSYDIYLEVGTRIAQAVQ